MMGQYLGADLSHPAPQRLEKAQYTWSSQAVAYLEDSVSSECAGHLSRQSLGRVLMRSSAYESITQVSRGEYKEQRDMGIFRESAYGTRSLMRVCRLLLRTQDRSFPAHRLHGGPLLSMKHRTWQQICPVSQLIPHRRVHKADHLLFSTGSACLNLTRYVREGRNLGWIGVIYSHGLLARRWIG